jgi:hypothetical protein
MGREEQEKKLSDAGLKELFGGNIGNCVSAETFEQMRIILEK